MLLIKKNGNSFQKTNYEGGGPGGMDGTFTKNIKIEIEQRG